MDRLWAPWRIKYVKAKWRKICIFCQSMKSKGKNYVIFITDYSIAMLNIFPYNNGHIMIASRRHVKEFSQLKEIEALDLIKALNKAKKLLDNVLKPDGYNIGINLSKDAGAGITAHMHIHIVPRYRGDANFMPTLYDTKVISQSLDELYKQLNYAKSKSD